MLRIIKYLSSCFVFLVVLFACNSDSKIEAEIAAIPLEYKLNRFDLEFAKITPNDLPEIKQKYPLLFPKQYHDSIWLNTIKDSFQIALNKAVIEGFPDFSKQQQDLELLFKHFEYYFPEFEPPTVYTVISFVDYRNKVLAKNNDLIIGIDNYLGADHPFYTDIPLYIGANLKPDQLVQDVAYALGRRFVSPPADRTFLGQMIYYGKLLYLKDILLPETPENERIGYSKEHLEWSRENEADIWRYFIEKEVLFSTQAKLVTQFISPAPFSKFYLEIDNESPGRIGRYIGWKMVRQFMEKNNLPLRTMLNTPAATIYEQSNYKPEK